VYFVSCQSRPARAHHDLYHRRGDKQHRRDIVAAIVGVGSYQPAHDCGGGAYPRICYRVDRLYVGIRR
jgi:hypothetical protein